MSCRPLVPFVCCVIMYRVLVFGVLCCVVLCCVVLSLLLCLLQLLIGACHAEHIFNRGFQHTRKPGSIDS